MKKFQRIIHSILIVFFVFSVSFAQDEVLNLVQRPAPEADNLGKYGEVPISLNRGIPNINIPLYSYKGDELELNISISYHGSGFKVSEKASWVGLGWVLNAGGVITRTVHGLPDEYSYYEYYNTWIDEVKGSGCTVSDDDSPGCQWAIDAAIGLKDFEPDEYYYNFDGKSGSISISQNKEIFGIPNEYFKIEHPDNETWKITTTDGVIYYFQDIEWSTHQLRVSYISAWYLSKIIDPRYNETIEFSYSVRGIDWEESLSTYQTTTEVIPHTSSATPTNWCNVMPSILETEPGTTRALYLNTIQYEKHNIQVNIETENDREDILGGESLLRLKSIRVIRQDNSEPIRVYNFDNNHYFIGNNYNLKGTYDNKRLKLENLTESIQGTAYKFEYNSTHLPSYLSADYDHWGYYNYGSSHNTSIIPELSPALYLNGTPINSLASANKEVNTSSVKACMLEKITYPTGGYTEFVWEPHVFAQENIEENVIKTSTVSCSGGEGLVMNNLEQAFADYIYNQDPQREGMPINVKMDFIVINQTDCMMAYKSLTKNNPYGEDYCDAYLYKAENLSENDLHENQLGLLLPNEFQPFDFTNSDHFGDGSINKTPIQLQEGVYVIFTAVSENYTGSSITAQLEYLKKIDVPYKNTYVGGVRIKQIKNSNDNTSQDIIRNFYYVYDYGENLPSDAPANYERSSLKLFHNPYSGVYSYEYYGGCRSTYKVCSFLVDNIGFPAQLQFLGSHIGYDEVAEVINDGSNGIIIHKFLNDNNDRLYRDLKTDEIYKNSSGDIVRTVQNTYTDKLFLPVSTYGEKVKIVKAYKPEASIIGIDYDFVYLSISYATWWRGLETTTITEYENNAKTIEKSTYYEYDGAEDGLYNLPSRITQKSSNKNVTTYSLYPHDYSDNSGFIAEMKTRNLIKPIEIVTLQSDLEGNNTKVIDGKIIEYKGGQLLGLPFKINQFESEFPRSIENFRFSNSSTTGMPGSNPTSYSLNDTYYKQKYFFTFSSNGNLITSDKKDDISSAYVWAYNNSYPVLQVTGKTYSELETDYSDEITYITNDENLPGSLSITNLRTKVATIKTQLNDLFNDPNCQVTLITYDPPFGMTSTTGPDKVTTYYKYDEFGRLSVVYDNEGNILKAYDYHYATPQE